MAPLPPAEFAALLADLDREGFEAFLEDLWAARGRDARVEDGVLVGGPRSYLIDHDPSKSHGLLPGGRGDRPLPSPGERDADAVVTSRRIDTPPADVRAVDADELRGMALYAVDRETRRDLFDRHFGRPPTATGRPWDRLFPGAVSRGALVAVLALALALAVVGAAVGPGAIPGDPSGPAVRTAAPPTASPAPRPTPVGAATPSPTPEPTATPGPAPLLRLNGAGGQDPVSAAFETDGRPVIVEFTPSISGGFFGLWIIQGGGTRRWLAGGSGSGPIRALLDLPAGRHRLFVQTDVDWTAAVTPSGPPPDAGGAGNPPVEFAGPLEFSPPTSVTVHGFEANRSYDVAVTDLQGNRRAELVDRNGSVGATSMILSYRGRGYVRVVGGGRWTVVLRPADRR